MKIIIKGVIICILFFGFSNSTEAAIGSLRTNRALVKNYTDGGGNEYRIYSEPSVTVITPKSFSMHFFTNGNSAKQLATSFACNAVLNGTYFGYNPDGSYFPAGVWYQFGMYLRQPYQPAVDRNLRVLLSGNGTTIDPIVNDTFNFATLEGNKNGRYGNAGPWLVQNGRINPDIVNTKSHWQKDTTRVGFIRNPSGEIHFIIATEPISLPQFIVFSYGVGLGTGAFQFINLDGGSSTSMITPYNSYYAKRRLPSFICIH